MWNDVENRVSPYEHDLEMVIEMEHYPRPMFTASPSRNEHLGRHAHVPSPSFGHFTMPFRHSRYEAISFPAFLGGWSADFLVDLKGELDMTRSLICL